MPNCLLYSQFAKNEPFSCAMKTVLSSCPIGPRILFGNQRFYTPSFHYVNKGLFIAMWAWSCWITRPPWHHRGPSSTMAPRPSHTWCLGGLDPHQGVICSRDHRSVLLAIRQTAPMCTGRRGQGPKSRAMAHLLFQAFAADRKQLTHFSQQQRSHFAAQRLGPPTPLRSSCTKSLAKVLLTPTIQAKQSQTTPASTLQRSWKRFHTFSIFLGPEQLACSTWLQNLEHKHVAVAQ